MNQPTDNLDEIFGHLHSQATGVRGTYGFGGDFVGDFVGIVVIGGLGDWLDDCEDDCKDGLLEGHEVR